MKPQARENHPRQSQSKRILYAMMILGLFGLAAYAAGKGAVAPDTTQTSPNTLTTDKDGAAIPGTEVNIPPVIGLAPPGTFPPMDTGNGMDRLAPGTAVGDAPLPARNFGITGYEAKANDPAHSRISMAWNTGDNLNPSAVTATILRSSVSGPYETVAFYDTVPTNENKSFTDENAIADQYNCYWVIHRNSVTSRAVGPLCVFGPSSDAVKVTRARINIQVGNIEDAGTDSGIAVALQPAKNASAHLPRGNLTWLDTEDDDFEATDNHTYELLPNNISTTSDVTALRVEVSGDDDICISALSLQLNEEFVFTKNYAPCVWVSEAAPLSEDIRPENVLAPVFPHIYTDYEYLDNIIRATIGNSLHDKPVSWNQVSGPNPEGFTSDETHRYYRAWLFVHGSLGTRFPFEFEVVLRADSGPCQPGVPQTFSIVPEYVDTDAPIWFPFLEPLAELVENYIPEIEPTNFSLPAGICGRLIFGGAGFELEPL
jgi:hypothetical protein